MRNKHSSLYKRVHNYNKHFSHTRKCISYYIRRCIMRNKYSSLYKRVYNDNKYFVIHENVFLII